MSGVTSFTSVPIIDISGLSSPERAEQHRVATPLEPLFDLSFVVAIALAASQLHHGVMEHHTGPALAGFVAAFVAIWCAWMNYT